MPSLCVELRRARPLLGTLVEIRASGSDRSAVGAAVDAAFEEIARVHARMSYHDSDSDVAQLNRRAWGDAVRVDPRTFEVLALACRLFRLTEGDFDAAIAPTLVRNDLLPLQDCGALPVGTSADIELLPDRHVRFRRPLAIDLGGIAKGYAVDRAVEILQARGLRSGCVNAGGDLRLFGGREAVHVRLPGAPGRVMRLAEITDASLATTAGYFAPAGMASVVDPRRGVLAERDISVSVSAPACALADALTKVVWLRQHAADAVLRRLGARAWIIPKEASRCETAIA